MRWHFGIPTNCFSRGLRAAARWRDLVGEDVMEYGDLSKRYAVQTFGAHFAEVGVDVSTGEIRVRHMLAVCSAERIINPKTARSRVIGGMTMGIGAALMEELVVDKRLGFFVNHSLAGYEVPAMRMSLTSMRFSSRKLTPRSRRSKRKVWASLASAAWPLPSPTPFTTPPACVSGNTRSRWTSFSVACRPWHKLPTRQPTFCS
jgi:hypothetical protein